MTNTKPVNQRLEYSYDVISDVLTINGIKYAGFLFRGMAILPINTWVRIVDRDNGTLTLETAPPGDPPA